MGITVPSLKPQTISSDVAGVHGELPVEEGLGRRQQSHQCGVSLRPDEAGTPVRSFAQEHFEVLRAL